MYVNHYNPKRANNLLSKYCSTTKKGKLSRKEVLDLFCYVTLALSMAIQSLFNSFYTRSNALKCNDIFLIYIYFFLNKLIPDLFIHVLLYDTTYAKHMFVQRYVGRDLRN